MKILFLDVDGVLNIMSSSYYTYAHGIKLEDHLIRRLEFIFERVSNLYIVISSSWRTDELMCELEKHNFKYLTKIIDRTSREKQYRGEQIYDYIVNNDLIENMCILEDEPDDICGTRCNKIDKEFVVRVNMEVGLSHTDTIKAIHILNEIDDNRDGMDVKYTNIGYDTYISKGYRPQVIYDPIKDNGKWKYMRLDNKNMILHLHN